MHTIIPIEPLIHIDGLVSAFEDVWPPSHYFPGESHNFWEMVYVHSGAVTATADERVYHLTSGNLLFHKPMEFHRIWSEGGSSPHVMIIAFPASGSAMEQFRERCLFLSSREQSQFQEVFSVFIRAYAAYNQQDIEAQHLYTARTAALLENFLLSLSEAQSHIQHTYTAEDTQYTKIVNTMRKNCHRSMSLQELAQECDLSVSNMKRIFHQFSDIGISKFFLSLKMRRAMELLDNGIPASQVSSMLDFSETSYFYTVFKRETGMTPTQYKRSRTNLREP